jgi:hypothetical protein
VIISIGHSSPFMRMLRTELVAGYLLAGFAEALIPGMPSASCSTWSDPSR